MAKKAVKCVLKDIPIVSPPDMKISDSLEVEDTGRGNTICMDGYFGRLFLSDEKAVKESCAAFNEEYQRMCRAVDEDPSGMFCEVLNYNDLYRMQGLSWDTVAGDDYGWPTAEDWRTHGIEFNYEWLLDGPLVEKYRKKIFVFTPKEFCKPDMCYREVS